MVTVVLGGCQVCHTIPDFPAVRLLSDAVQQVLQTFDLLLSLRVCGLTLHNESNLPKKTRIAVAQPGCSDLDDYRHLTRSLAGTATNSNCASHLLAPVNRPWTLAQCAAAS